MSPTRPRQSHSKRRNSSLDRAPDQTSSPPPADQNEEAAIASQLVELSASRFVGDLDPQSIFIEAAQKRSQQPLHRNHSDVGTWMRQPSERPNQAASPEKGAKTPASQARNESKAPESAPTPGLRLLPPYNDLTDSDEQLTVCPPQREFTNLLSIYYDQIHPILPFIEPADLDALINPAESSPRKHVFRQVVALAAAVDSSTTSLLRLEANGPLLSFQDFHQRLAKAIFLSLDANILIDRVDRIRILLLLSFFYQPSNPLERDTNPLIFSQAVHFAQSLGIHLRGYRNEKLSEDGAVERLFCLCWALDRINAAFHGRPCLLHERDTDRDLDECIAAQQEPAFRLFMIVAKLLDSVIWLYRPRNETAGTTVELPIFESMIVSVGGERLHPRILTTVEVFYHAVSVLSCRQPLTEFQLTASPLAHLPQPALNARRSLSADRIIEIIESCLSSADGLCTLPFVPYAVALSLSVAYRKMRYSRIPMYRLRGKNRFKDVVGFLQKLGEVYTSARVNASLGVSILRELDKTVKEFASGSMLTPGDTTTTTTSIPSGSVTKSVRRSGASRPAAGNQGVPHIVGRAPAFVGTGNPAADHQDTTTQAYTNQITTPQFNTSATVNTPSYQRLMISNPADPSSSSWAQVEDIDLFGHFDPAYDLNAVEAALEANLDMGFPQTWTMPWMG